MVNDSYALHTDCFNKIRNILIYVIMLRKVQTKFKREYDIWLLALFIRWMFSSMIIYSSIFSFYEETISFTKNNAWKYNFKKMFCALCKVIKYIHSIVRFCYCCQFTTFNSVHNLFNKLFSLAVFFQRSKHEMRIKKAWSTGSNGNKDDDGDISQRQRFAHFHIYYISYLLPSSM